MITGHPTLFVQIRRYYVEEGILMTGHQGRGGPSIDKEKSRLAAMGH